MKISNIFSNHMVLQRDEENKIKGTKEPFEEISVSFDGKTYSAITDEKEYWEITLPAYKAGGPYDMTIQSSLDEEIIVEDICFGDVFLLGGQSNMELSMNMILDCSREEIKTAENDKIRMFQVAKDFDFSQRPKMLDAGEWLSVTPDTVGDCSAIGYYFAKEKVAEDGVYVGLVHTAVGGAPIEAYMSKENVLSCASLIRKTHPMDGECDQNKNMSCIYCYEKMYEQDANPEFVEKTIEEDNKRVEAYNANIEKNDPGLKSGWLEKWKDEADVETFRVPNSFYRSKYENYRGTMWFQKLVEVPEEFLDKECILYLGTLVDSDKTYVNGTFVGATDYKYPPRRYVLKPGVLKNGTNVITIRLGIDSNTGSFVQDMPYYIKCGDKTVAIDGKWKMRKGYKSESLEGPTFFIWHPSALYYSMIASLKDFKFKAILFYQGESNCGHPEYYGTLFKSLIDEWRSLFGKIPFIYAEITHYLGDGPVYYDDPFDGVRDVQREIEDELLDAYLVRTYDLGQFNELHPQNKDKVAKRFFDIYSQI